MRRIGLVAREVGRGEDTLRRMEKAGLIPSPKRDRAGRRLYSDADVETIKRVVLTPRQLHPA